VGSGCLSSMSISVHLLDDRGEKRFTAGTACQHNLIVWNRGGGGRAVRMITIIIGIFAMSYSAIVRADGYKDVVDAAYCVGSLRKQDEITKTLVMGNTSYELAMLREVESKLLERQTLVEGAIKQGTLFAAVATRMINDGYADADSCTQMNSKCTLEHIKRLQGHVDKAASDADFDDCTRPIVAICNKIHKCDG